MTQKETYFLRLVDIHTGKSGIGECAIFRGLSSDDHPDYETRLASLCKTINDGIIPDEPLEYSSLQFGYEIARMAMEHDGGYMMADTPWSHGIGNITINGLVWMGSAEEMLARIDMKLKDGFKCIKLKIGGIDFKQELELLQYIRASFGHEKLELRLDANGAFTPDNALSKLDMLARYDIHSLEQPIRQGQWSAMSEICRYSPIDIALDEELIGVHSSNEKKMMLNRISPRYIILKPSLCGGFRSADEWIALASERNIGWWATSALESNIGLNAIAQWVSQYNPGMPQGLGTGQLYENNIESPLRLTGDKFTYDVKSKWVLPDLKWIVP